MIVAMGVHIQTGREVKGEAWAKRYPEKAGDLWVVVHANRKRDREYIGPPTPKNRERAEARAAEWRAALRILTGDGLGIETFARHALEYLRVGMDVHGLAATTRDDRRAMLSAGSLVMRELGERSLETITAETLMSQWWTPFVIEGGRSPATGKRNLAAISGVFAYAIQRGLVTRSPVDGLRLMLRRVGRTKGARSETAGTKAAPIEPLEDLVKILDVAADWRRLGRPLKRKASPAEIIKVGDVPIAILLMLDAGLRVGEVFGLRWRHVWWGRNAQDTNRHLSIEEARARGQHEGKPKSGRAREVEMSQRLRAALRERWLELGQPELETRVIVRRDVKKMRDGAWARVRKQARVGDYDMKQLRDSFASYLITAGVSLGWISEQLGHADIATTARHYARWIKKTGYQEPLVLESGEVPSDLLGRLTRGGATKRHHHTTKV